MPSICLLADLLFYCCFYSFFSYGLFACRSVCLSIYVTKLVCLFGTLFACSPAWLSFFLCPSICLSVCVFACPPLFLSISLPISLLEYQVYSSVCLSAMSTRLPVCPLAWMNVAAPACLSACQAACHRPARLPPSITLHTSPQLINNNNEQLATSGCQFHRQTEIDGKKEEKWSLKREQRSRSR